VAKALRRRVPWLQQALSPSQVSIALRSFKVHEFHTGDVLARYRPGSNGGNSSSSSSSSGSSSGSSSTGYSAEDDAFFIIQEGRVKCTRRFVLQRAQQPQHASPAAPPVSPRLTLCFPHADGTMLGPDSPDLDTFGYAALLQTAPECDWVLSDRGVWERMGAEKKDSPYEEVVEYAAANDNVIVLTISRKAFVDIVNPNHEDSWIGTAPLPPPSAASDSASSSSTPASSTSSAASSSVARDRCISSFESLLASITESVQRKSRRAIFLARRPEGQSPSFPTPTSGPSTPTMVSPVPSVPHRSALKKVDFTLIQRVKVLGLGSFGRVELVRYRQSETGQATDLSAGSDTAAAPPATGKGNSQLFALKIQQKAHIVASKQAIACMRERQLLEECRHPFICRLHATFADKDLLYMLLECVVGGELFQLLSAQPER
jgi:hypothetical protein